MRLIDIDKLPPMPREEENDLILRWQRYRDREALDRLVRTHIWLLRKYAYMYQMTVNVEDALSEALFGFIHALDRYNPDGGASIGSYGQLWVRAALQKYRLREKCRGKTGDAMSSPCTHNRIMKNIARERTLSGWNEDEDQYLGSEFSLDAPLGEAGGATFYNVVEEASYEIESALEEADMQGRLAATVSLALERLPEDLAFVLQCRYMTTPMWTLKEVGESLGISREAARQKEANAKRLVRRVLLSYKDNIEDLWGPIDEVIR